MTEHLDGAIADAEHATLQSLIDTDSTKITQAELISLAVAVTARMLEQRIRVLVAHSIESAAESEAHGPDRPGRVHGMYDAAHIARGNHD